MSIDKSAEVISLVSETFESTATPESTFEDLGSTSVSLLRLMTALQQKFGVDVDVVDMFTIDSVADLITLVNERTPTQGSVSR